MIDPLILVCINLSTWCLRVSNIICWRAANSENCGNKLEANHNNIRQAQPQNSFQTRRERACRCKAINWNHIHAVCTHARMWNKLRRRGRGDRNLHSIDPSTALFSLSGRVPSSKWRCVAHTEPGLRFPIPRRKNNTNAPLRNLAANTQKIANCSHFVGDERDREARVSPVLQSAQPFLISRIATPSRASSAFPCTQCANVSARARETTRSDKKAQNLPTRRAAGEPSQCSHSSQQVHPVESLASLFLPTIAARKTPAFKCTTSLN
jgi:hypothetical protein